MAIVRIDFTCPQPPGHAKALARIVFILITLHQGRSAALKAGFMAGLARALAAAGLADAADVFINQVDVAPENWLFGLGDG